MPARAAAAVQSTVHDEIAGELDDPAHGVRRGRRPGPVGWLCHALGRRQLRGSRWQRGLPAHVFLARRRFRHAWRRRSSGGRAGLRAAAGCRDGRTESQGLQGSRHGGSRRHDRELPGRRHAEIRAVGREAHRSAIRHHGAQTKRDSTAASVDGAARKANSRGIGPGVH